MYGSPDQVLVAETPAVMRQLPRARRWLAALGAAALLSGLAGCGSGWSPVGVDPPAEFAITGAIVDVQGDSALIQGTGFIPPGSVCPSADCFGPPVFGQLGPHELRWSNAGTGGSSSILMRWICNCGSQATLWEASVRIEPGPNAITVAMTAGSRTEQDTVTLTGF